MDGETAVGGVADERGAGSSLTFAYALGEVATTAVGGLVVVARYGEELGRRRIYSLPVLELKRVVAR
jgi:hypothetical protein